MSRAFQDARAPMGPPPNRPMDAPPSKKGGSVKAARERLLNGNRAPPPAQFGLPSNPSPPPTSPLPARPVNAPAAARSRFQAPSNFDPSIGEPTPPPSNSASPQGPRNAPQPPAQRAQKARLPPRKPVALSPAPLATTDDGAPLSPQEPQWPLTSNPPKQRQPTDRRREISPEKGGTNTSPDRGPPPQRPPRPPASAVPSMLNAAEQRMNFTRPGPVAYVEPQQATWVDDDLLSPQYSSSYGSGEYASPNSSRPLTLSSAASTGSSVGEIPDFPLPATAPPGIPYRRSGNIGPPPSARRGPSSYYSQISYVSPIVEESERSRDSYASSSVIPDFYPEEADGTPSENGDSNRAFETGSPESTGADHNDRSGLVRQASLGQRHKPALTTIRSGEGARPDDKPMRKFGPKRVAGPAAAAGVGGAAVAAAFANREDLRDRPRSGSLRGGTGLLDPSPSSSVASSPISSPTEIAHSKEMLGRELKSPTVPPRARSPLAPVDPGVDKILGGLDKEAAIRSPKTGGSFMERRAGGRRPPRLNVDAVRDAEARGSLTSLPDLIRRATRLASNLDRGKTASRLGMDWMTGEVDHEKNIQQNRRSAGSLTDILASFPPPALGTPRSAGSPRGGSPQLARKPSNLAFEQTPQYAASTPTEKQEKRRRRCCGMPLWVFWTLILILFLLIVAAVIVPIVLIVIPRAKTNTTNAGMAAQMDMCENNTPCLNGGSTTVNANGTCGCLCADGFTGPTCASTSDPSCSSITTTNNKNATIGNALPRLFSSAQANFSVPLNSTTILSVFNANNVSCTAENALVTFNGAAQKRFILPDQESIDIERISAEAAMRPPSPKEPLSPKYVPPLDRQFHVAPRSLNPGPAQTSNGILYAASTTPTTTLVNPNINPTRTTVSPASATADTQHAIDFARISVLFLLQNSMDLNQAVDAQEQLQTFFQNGASGALGSTLATNITLATSYRANLVDCTLTMPDGSVVGGVVS